MPFGTMGRRKRDLNAKVGGEGFQLTFSVAVPGFFTAALFGFLPFFDTLSSTLTKYVRSSFGGLKLAKKLEMRRYFANVGSEAARDVSEAVAVCFDGDGTMDRTIS